MQAVRGDEDRNPWLEGDVVSIYLEAALTFEHIIDFRHLLVKMRSTVLGDFHDMHRGHLIVPANEGAF